MTLLDFIAGTGTHAGDSWINGGGLSYQIQTTKTTVNPTWLSGSYFAGAVVSASYFSTETPATLTITSTAVPEGFLSTAYSATNSLYSNILTATGGVQPYTWSCPATCALPAGLSLNSSTGAITGTPTSAGGPTNVTFKVTDAQSTTATVTLPMTVATTKPSLTAPTGCPIAIQYQSYSGCSFSVVSGGTAPLVLSIPAPTSDVYPPEGITVDSSSGALGGTFYGGGEYTFAAQLTDAAGYFAQASFTFKGEEKVLPGSEWPSGTSIWSHRIDSLPADTSPMGTVLSAYAPTYLRFYTNDGGYGGAIPQIIVPCTQPYVSIGGNLQYFSTAPFPDYAPIEGGPKGTSDNHVLVIMQACGSTPAQEFDVYNSGGWSSWGAAGWVANGGANYEWNITGSPTTNFGITMPFDQDNADNLGGPMAQVIWKVDDIIGGGTESSPTGALTYPQRLILQHTLNKFVWPGTTPQGTGSCTGGYEDSSTRMALQQDPPTSCGGSTNWPIGEMVRLKSSFSLPSCATGNPYATILFNAMYQYGFILADQGTTGSVTLSPDERWASIANLASALTCIHTTVQLQDLEGVNVSSLMPTITNWSVTNNIFSGTTANPHGFFTGQKVRLVPQNIPTDAWLNTSIAQPGTCGAATAAVPCTFTITSTATPTTFTLDLTTGQTTHTDVATNSDPVYVATYQTIPPSLVSISVSPSTASILTVTGTQQLTPSCTYSDSSVDNCTQAGGVTWAPLSGSLIANSNSSGLVTAANKVGSVTVTATNGSISGSAAITTYAVPTSSWQGLGLQGFTIK